MAEEMNNLSEEAQSLARVPSSNVWSRTSSSIWPKKSIRSITKPATLSFMNTTTATRSISWKRARSASGSLTTT